ncbi:MAG: 2OG-Fe(II) oxygenase [Sneathiella sp.]
MFPDICDWQKGREALSSNGYWELGKILPDDMCDQLAGTYDQEALFRSRIVMSRYQFGSGEYQYFAYPLPGIVEKLRTHCYEGLQPVANEWSAQLGQSERYPASLTDYLALCHAAEQMRPTPLLLKYGAGDYNCLHQDLYGEEYFPIQMAICLSEPGRDFDGGEFVLTHQRPRMQSVATVLSPKKGEAIAFAVNTRPVKGARGYYQVKMRHGVSPVKRGKRLVLGLILHDAR